jgi:hypothetical protein
VLAVGAGKRHLAAQFPAREAPVEATGKWVLKISFVRSRDMPW